MTLTRGCVIWQLRQLITPSTTSKRTPSLCKNIKKKTHTHAYECGECWRRVKISALPTLRILHRSVGNCKLATLLIVDLRYYVVIMLFYDFLIRRPFHWWRSCVLKILSFRFLSIDLCLLIIRVRLKLSSFFVIGRLII